MLDVGLHKNIPLADYLAMGGLGSTQLGWLAKSPLYYRYMIDHPEAAAADTDATFIGSAVHMAALEPDLFAATYCVEPDPFAVAPDAKKPRATNAYKDAVAEIEAAGQMVLRFDQYDQVTTMASAIMSHVRAARLMAKAPERELTLSWRRGDDLERVCRGRADLLGDGVLVDLKTTRNLRKFSPFGVTQFGYHRQAAWYVDGLRRLGREVRYVFFIAIESEPPYDVGVFELQADALELGKRENEDLLLTLEECEAAREWPGMYTEVQVAKVTDTFAAEVEIETMEVADAAQR